MTSVNNLRRVSTRLHRKCRREYYTSNFISPDGFILVRSHKLSTRNRLVYKLFIQFLGHWYTIGINTSLLTRVISRALLLPYKVR